MLFAFFSARQTWSTLAATLFARRRRPDVYTLSVDSGSRGTLYVLFRRELDPDTIVSLLKELTYMKESINLVLVGAHTVKVIWHAKAGESLIAGYCRRGIELTIFECALGTWEPDCVRWSMFESDIADSVRSVGREQGIDWAREFGFRT